MLAVDDYEQGGRPRKLVVRAARQRVMVVGRSVLTRRPEHEPEESVSVTL